MQELSEYKNQILTRCSQNIQKLNQNIDKDVNFLLKVQMDYLSQNIQQKQKLLGCNNAQRSQSQLSYSERNQNSTSINYQQFKDKYDTQDEPIMFQSQQLNHQEPDLPNEVHTTVIHNENISNSLYQSQKKQKNFRQFKTTKMELRQDSSYFNNTADQQSQIEVFEKRLKLQRSFNINNEDQQQHIVNFYKHKNNVIQEENNFLKQKLQQFTYMQYKYDYYQEQGVDIDKLIKDNKHLLVVTQQLEEKCQQVKDQQQQIEQLENKQVNLLFQYDNQLRKQEINQQIICSLEDNSTRQKAAIQQLNYQIQQFEDFQCQSKQSDQAVQIVAENQEAHQKLKEQTIQISKLETTIKYQQEQLQQQDNQINHLQQQLLEMQNHNELFMIGKEQKKAIEQEQQEVDFDEGSDNIQINSETVKNVHTDQTNNATEQENSQQQSYFEQQQINQIQTEQKLDMYNQIVSQQNNEQLTQCMSQLNNINVFNRVNENNNSFQQGICDSSQSNTGLQDYNKYSSTLFAIQANPSMQLIFNQVDVINTNSTSEQLQQNQKVENPQQIQQENINNVLEDSCSTVQQQASNHNTIEALTNIQNNSVEYVNIGNVPSIQEIEQINANQLDNAENIKKNETPVNDTTDTTQQTVIHEIKQEYTCLKEQFNEMNQKYLSSEHEIQQQQEFVGDNLNDILENKQQQIYVYDKIKVAQMENEFKFQVSQQDEQIQSQITDKGVKFDVNDELMNQQELQSTDNKQETLNDQQDDETMKTQTIQESSMDQNVIVEVKQQEIDSDDQHIYQNNEINLQSDNTNQLNLLPNNSTEDKQKQDNETEEHQNKMQIDVCENEIGLQYQQEQILQDIDTQQNDELNQNEQISSNMIEQNQVQEQPQIEQDCDQLANQCEVTAEGDNEENYQMKQNNIPIEILVSENINNDIKSSNDSNDSDEHKSQEKQVEEANDNQQFDECIGQEGNNSTFDINIQETQQQSEYQQELNTQEQQEDNCDMEQQLKDERQVEQKEQFFELQYSDGNQPNQNMDNLQNIKTIDNRSQTPDQNLVTDIQNDEKLNTNYDINEQ